MMRWSSTSTLGLAGLGGTNNGAWIPADAEKMGRVPWGDANSMLFIAIEGH